MDLLPTLEKSFLEIANLMKNQNTLDLGDYMDEYNFSGDDVKQLDLMSNVILKTNLKKCGQVRCIGSEEDKELHYTEHKNAPYLICFDPLDGSSNIDVNITTGTIFAVYQYDDKNEITNGRNIIMSGYSLYGASTQYIIAYHNNVSMYQYVPSEEKFVCVKTNMKLKERGNIYSINEANKHMWCDKRFVPFIDSCIKENYSTRWVGSLVADAHRTLIKGGFFAYPANKKNEDGKIRLLYEAYPFAHIFEVAGGFGSNGEEQLLDIPFPKNIHQKTPIILSSNSEFTKFITTL
jgi:fructose-1,6-bisphosphatase I